MGSSPTKKIELSVEVFVDFKNLTKQYPDKDTEDLPPPPNFQPVIKAIAKGSDGKPISTRIKYKQVITEDNEESTKPELNENETNDDPPKKNEKKDVNKNEDNELSIFNKNNINEINKENNADENNNINKKEEKINILKEGVNEVTKFGEDEKDDKISNPQTVTGENKDINLPNKKYEDNNNENITPEERNKSNNIGYNYQNKEKEYKNKGFNWGEKDLDLSQSVVMKNKEDIYQNSYEMLQKGYFPLLMQLDNYDLNFFFIKEESTLKSLLKAYIQSCPRTNDGIMNDIKLYEGKRLLDINTPICELKLKLFSKISNKMADDNKNSK